MSDDNSRALSRSALAFLSGTFISRFTGFLRDVSMAFCFGTNPSIAAFMVAFRFSNLFRRLFGEGPLPSGFIPHFEGLRAESSRKGALFFRDLFFSLCIVLIGLIALAEGGLYVWLQNVSPSSGTGEILRLSMIMFPGLLFICLFGLFSSVLQCNKQFFLSGFAPVAFNLVWIGAAMLLRDVSPQDAAVGIAFAIVIAFFMQWAMTIPKVIATFSGQLNLRDWFQARFFSVEMRQIVKPLLLIIIGVSAIQVNSLIDALFARFAEVEGPAYLWYAIRIQQLPLALFGVAFASALLPSLSRLIKAADWTGYRELLKFALKRCFHILLPITIGIIVLGLSGINLIFGRGQFDPDSVYHTTLCLWGYGIGLVPAALVMLLSPGFYARKDYRTPMIAAVLSVFLNVALNSALIFYFHLGALSIAIATSIAAAFNCRYLFGKLSVHLGTTLWTNKELFSFLKTILSSVLAGVMTLAMGHFLIGDATLSALTGQKILPMPELFPEQVLHFLILSGSYLILFFSYAWMFNITDILELVGLKRGESEPNAG